MDEKNIMNMATIFRLLSNPNRLQALLLCQEEGISVGSLVNSLNLSQSLVIHHLKQLREANLIQTTRCGKNILYQVKDKRVRCILRDMLTHTSVARKKGQKNS